MKVLGTPDSEEDYAENEKNLRYDKPVITNFGKVESITFCFSASNYYDNEEIPLRLISVKVYLESEKDKMEELLTEYYGKFDEVSKVRSISDNMNSISNESITGTEYEAYVYGWESNSFGELSKKEQSEFADVYSAHLGEQGIIEWVTNTEKQQTEITINYSTTDGKCVVLMDDTLGYLIDQMRENK